MAFYTRLPALKGGTPKQRKFACAIRLRAIRDLETRHDNVMIGFENGEPDDYEHRCELYALRDALLAQRDFGWWIGKRDDLVALDSMRRALGLNHEPIS